LNKTKNKKNNFNKTTALILAGVLLVVFIGIVVVSAISGGKGSGSFFADMGVGADGKIQIKENENLFIAETQNDEVMSAYNEALQILIFNGKMSKKSVSIGKLFNIDLKEGEEYKFTVKYVGGTYETSSGNEPKISFELQQDGKNYSDRTYGTHYVSAKLPLNNNQSFEKIITITDATKDASNFYYWLWQATAGATTFKNYRIQVLVTKVITKIVSADGTYGELSEPEKDGYKFLGWFDSLSGNNKIDSTTQIAKKYSHTLYAHWEQIMTDVPVDECPEGQEMQDGVCVDKPVDPVEDPSDDPPVGCNEGYSMKDGKCIPNCDVDNCSSCDTPNVCSKCASGYTLNNGTCVMNCNVQNCSTCGSPNKCSKCNSGYVLNNNKCSVKQEKCPDNCVTCSNGKCTKCETGYKVENGACVVSCPSGYTLENGECKPNCFKVANCAACSAPNVCSQCNPEYQLINNKCVARCHVSYCEKCNTPNHCDKCKTGYKLENGVCTLSCGISNCEKCSSANKCSKCKTGYKLSGNTCIRDCGAGYTLYNGKCLKCSGNYVFSTITGKCEPLTCPVNQSAVNGKCVSCPSNCSTCNSTTNCLTCKSGYQLQNGKCVASGCSVANCKTCVTNNNKACFTCNSGYQLQNGQCIKDTTCPDGYGLINGKCQKCNVSGCARCNGNLNRCDSCQRYTGLNNGTCTKCSVSNCSDCYGNYKVCTLCKDGYKLENGKCVSTAPVAKYCVCKCNTGTYAGTCYKNVKVGWFGSDLAGTAACNRLKAIRSLRPVQHVSFQYDVWTCTRIVVAERSATCQGLGMGWGNLTPNTRTISGFTSNTCSQTCKAIGLTLNSGISKLENLMK
jgi:uncharacterized repeat protein (TIGR02543 family)